MKQRPNVWEVCILIMVCTVCSILLINIIGIMVLKIPTNDANAPVRAKLIDLLGIMIGGVISIISIKINDKIK